jgi:hypothetical protein
MNVLWLFNSIEAALGLFHIGGIFFHVFTTPVAPALLGFVFSHPSSLGKVFLISAAPKHHTSQNLN